MEYTIIYYYFMAGTHQGALPYLKQFHRGSREEIGKNMYALKFSGLDMAKPNVPVTFLSFEEASKPSDCLQKQADS